MLARVLPRECSRAYAAFLAFRRRLSTALRPAATSSLVPGTATDLLRSKPELVAENALLVHQLIVLARSTKRPRISRSDRVLLVLLASRLRASPGAGGRPARDAAALAPRRLPSDLALHRRQSP